MTSNSIESDFLQVSDTRRTHEVLEELSSKAMLKGLKSIPVVARVMSGVWSPTPNQKFHRHIERVLENFDRQFAHQCLEKHLTYYNQGMRLAAVISCSAQQIAYEINDPYLKTLIAKTLIDIYYTELKEVLENIRSTVDFSNDEKNKLFNQSVNRRNEYNRIIKFAKNIVSEDPVTLYLQGKINLEQATQDIYRIARNKQQKAIRLFTQLVVQFQIQIGALESHYLKDKEPDNVIKRNSVSGKQENTKASFALEDLYGEISVSFFNETVVLDSNKKTRWQKATGCLTKKVIDKLELLKAELIERTTYLPQLTDNVLNIEKMLSSSKLNSTQLIHFARLRSSEEKELLANYAELFCFDQDPERVDLRVHSSSNTPEQYVINQISKRYCIEAAEAIVLKDALIDQLKKIPLTISCDVLTMFQERPDKRAVPFFGVKYRNRQVLAFHEHRLADVLYDPKIPQSKTVTALGHASQDYVRVRGINYMRWRREKDEKETGFHRLKADDLPVFGAINPNFDQIALHNLNCNDLIKEPKDCLEKGRLHGVNYYGNIHFILKDNLRSRSAFIARGVNYLKTFRIERLNLLLLLADMFRLSMYEYVDAITARVLGKSEFFVTHMEGEVHVYGGVDLTADISEIYAPSSVITAVSGPGKRLMKFAKIHGIPVIDIGENLIRIKPQSDLSSLFASTAK